MHSIKIHRVHNTQRIPQSNFEQGGFAILGLLGSQGNKGKYLQFCQDTLFATFHGDFEHNER